ncbi:hypothetical protein BX616_009305 [Lobosporangium transversale]|uniref:Uncharacterized protein n=1 Tax=Lobosporangium transversale TaxID=64571 RepID=A0A1Y2GYF1_9FUNG|nr:hypothetical protein BCR41DRAFT_411696 [Lobosporangium transversale]KAF9895594.1 hypothetical protein BX616_009305 [Lobosporangium transversale]ORZ27319.1 hypothetical protein BCR41DRAFT_411696 [Lobosporangium transversale]|eukprot:XP_021885046.1 hypothetical protein BCR41DRAFT_411696 [Lobosporangium transversale]
MAQEGSEEYLYNNVERQTRSNFDEEATYGKHAAVHPQFKSPFTSPVLLATLWHFKHQQKGWSGLKLAAYIFYELYSDKGVVLKKQVEDYLALIPHAKQGNGGIYKNLEQLVKVMKAEETRPVSAEVDKKLSGLADKIQTELTRINTGTITVNVEAQLKRILQP